MILQQIIHNDQLTYQLTRDNNSIADDRGQLIENKKNSELTNLGFISYKKRRLLDLQASNSLTHHEIYCQVANRNLEDYRSKIEYQIHTKYNIQKRNYKVSDLVKIQIAKINCGSGDYCALPLFPAGEVLLLGSKEFPELDYPRSIQLLVLLKLQDYNLMPLLAIEFAIVETTVLQQNAFVKKQTFCVEIDVIQKIRN
ncbi:515_t:CDS:2, partial [Scutellospora calospora]